MALRTPAEFEQGLQDDRRVYADGQLVSDVTTHPSLRIAVEHAANVYRFASEPTLSHLFTFSEGDQTLNRYFEPLLSRKALDSRARLIEHHTRLGRSTLNLTKAVGTDALAALHSVASLMGESVDADYVSRIASYRNSVAHGDLSIAVAQTDAKGDRGLAPHEQEDLDAYVRIVERTSDGIVVQGAKAHTTMAPVVDELIVLPTRAMGEADSQFAVAFAVPIDTEGIHMICGPLPNPLASSFDRPISSQCIEIESLTIFDRVFVPWERVFMAGEWPFAGPLAVTFANYHRFTAISYKLALGELLLGCAVAVTRLNGIANAGHVKQKLAELVQCMEILRACVEGAIRHSELVAGAQMLPSPMLCNVGKLHFASTYHRVVQVLQDLAGGFTITAPGSASWYSPETGPFVRKYIRGAGRSDPETRLRLFHLIRDLTASDFGGYNAVVTLHGEGSLQAQAMQILRSANLQPSLAAVAAVLGVDVEYLTASVDGPRS